MKQEDRLAHACWHKDERDGKIWAVGRKSEHSSPAITVADFQTSWAFHHAWMIAGFVIVAVVIVAGLSILRQYIVGFVGVSFQALVFVATMVFMRVTAMVQKQWGRLKPE